MTVSRQTTRRRVIGLAGVLGLGAVGSAALAACEEPPAERVVEEQADQVVTRAVALEPEQREPRHFCEVVPAAVGPETGPLASWVDVRFATNLTASPRGAAMRWGLEHFAKQYPEIIVRLEPAASLTGRVDAQFFQTSAPHLTLLSQADFLRFHDEGAFTEITAELEKRDGIHPEDYYFIPDAYTFNKIDHSFPQPDVMTGPQFGMPFQIDISGFVGNISLAEAAGVTLPDSDGGWTWDDWTEWDAKMTDSETGSYGSWARDSYEFQYMPQMYSNGLVKPFDDGLTKTMFDRPEAGEAWTYLIEKIFQHQTSPPTDRINELSGEYGDPFAAGKIGIWPSDRASSTGFAIPRIKDRFTWTLLPEVIAARGGPPGHSWHARANLVTVNAVREGVTSAATSLAVYLASEEYQCRVGIDRGHMPVHRAVIGAPMSTAPRPEGMHWLKVYADRPNNRSLFPFSTWSVWYANHRAFAQKGWTGEQSPADALGACQEWSERFFPFNAGPKPWVREPVYP